MKLVVKGKGLEISDSIRAYAQEKISKLDRYLDMPADGSLELSAEKTRTASDRIVAQVTISANGTLLRGEEKAGDPYTAIDSVFGVMQRQALRFKERLSRKGRASAAKAVAAQYEASSMASAETEGEPRLVKSKRFPIQLMAAEEAIEQMELLGHDFFVFLNSDSESISVLYRRKDGDYGLIEPELT